MGETSFGRINESMREATERNPEKFPFQKGEEVMVEGEQSPWEFAGFNPMTGEAMLKRGENMGIQVPAEKLSKIEKRDLSWQDSLKKDAPVLLKDKKTGEMGEWVFGSWVNGKAMIFQGGGPTESAEKASIMLMVDKNDLFQKGERPD